MRTFFASLLGTIVGLVVFAIGGTAIVIGGFAVLASMGDEPVVVEDGSYLVLDLSMNLTDAPPAAGLEQVFAALGGGDDKTMQLRTAIRALQAAADDDRIQGVFITGLMQPDGYGSGFAALGELRQAIVATRAAGKHVMAYFDYATARELYIGSAAEELVLDPYALVMFTGLRIEPMFYAGLFEKIGIGVQVTKVGTYKSAVEPYTRTGFSPESRQNLQRTIDTVWDHLVEGIAEGRGITPQAVQGLVDREGLIRPESAREAGLVTRLGYRDEALDELKRRTGREGSDQSFKQISLGSYATTLGADGAGSGSAARGDQIAIVYAEGMILDGDFEETGFVAGQRFAREIRQLRQDDEVKAIVLRINSPGGSAIASEQIRRELALAKQAKPVIVSMGTYAASGGYWIATASDRIFADPTTITGSIGVFGLHFDIAGLSEKVGVGFDAISTGERSGLLSLTQPRSPSDMAFLQRNTEEIYRDFLARVAEARGKTPEEIDAIAQGREWAGVQALEVGLVDELAGLDAAVAYAAEKAGVSDAYRVLEVPRQKELAEALGEAFGKLAPNHSRGAPLGDVWRRFEQEAGVMLRLNDPRSVYALLPYRVGGGDR